MNGKELQDELRLNMYDYGARNYDSALGKWMNIYPKAETSRRWSQYTYYYNNPMYFIDLDGMQAKDIYTYDDKSGKLNLAKKTDDKFDQIVKSDSKKEEGIATDSDSEPTVLVDKIAKGILKD